MAKQRRSFLVVPLVVLTCSLVAGLYGPGLGEASAATGDDEIRIGIKTFARVYDAVQENFADKVTADKAIYRGAIPGMLRTLDPHSSFLDPRDFQIMKEDQKGHYYGVGMTVAERNRKT